MARTDNRLKGGVGQPLVYLQGTNEIPIVDSNGNALSYVGGKVYYVEANDGDDSNNGLSWDNAFKTLTVGLATSHTNIGTGSATWASRNRIYYKGDNNEAAAEDITKFARKTDVFGLGSYDHRPHPMLIGNHTVVGSYMGCRFFNMGFKTPAAGGVLMTLPTGVSQPEFYDCVFDGDSTTKATKGILATAVETLKIINCKFRGKFSTTSIDIATGVGLGMLIEGNIIESGAIGIAIHSGYTCAAAAGLVLNNIFDVVTLLMDDNSSKVRYVGNRGTTAAVNTLSLILNYNDALACDNMITDATVTANYPTIGTTASG